MRNVLLTSLLALLTPALVAQDPAKPESKPAKTQQPAKKDKKPDGKGKAKPDPKAQAPKTDKLPKNEQKTNPAKPAKDTAVVGIEEKGADEIPAGLDPSDIAAMKSAQAMLKAEKRLKEMLKSGKFKDLDRYLTFEEIESWPYEDGLTGMPKAVKKLDGKKVMMTGFMLPIDEVEDIKEFLLVQSLWSCCYGQPPDINGIVRVVMKGKSRIDYQFDPIKIIGDFKVEAAYEDGYCLDIYQLHAESVEAIK